eukprot:COSAG02_NODE_1033_length_15063_cov_14.987503_7_plen_75_part_00
MMELYDVAFTSYHAQDGRALVEMSETAGVSASRVETLQRRVHETETQLHRVRSNFLCRLQLMCDPGCSLGSELY